jgi:CubicO group peptidase (beta-lactamase class C family)
MSVDVQTETQLPHSTPEAQGIPSSAILDFVAAVEERIDALHGFVLVRHGHIVAQGAWSPHGVDSQRTMFSLSKSFTSSGVGLAVAEGKLSVDDPVLKFFPDEAPTKVSENLAKMRVRDLLTMTTGHDADTLGAFDRESDVDWAQAILALPVDHEPGTHFVYNSGASYLLSAIVQRVTGEPLLDYLRPRLLDPLGITDATWETCPRGVNAGGWGLSIRLSEVARFGQMYLQEGMWQGRQVLPRTWVAEATARQVSNDNQTETDWRQGYGYQFWRARHGAYRGDGAFGQYCVVMPEQDAVLAIVSGVSNMQAVLDLVWEHLLPAMGAATLPADSAADAHLQERLATLALPGPAGAPTSPAADAVSGVKYHVRAEPSAFGPTGGASLAGRRFETISLVAGPEECRLTVTDSAGHHELLAATSDWRRGESSLLRGNDEPVAARAAWADDDTCTIKVCLLRTPFVFTLTLSFEGDQVTMRAAGNVSFNASEPVSVVGHRD